MKSFQAALVAGVISPLLQAEGIFAPRSSKPGHGSPLVWKKRAGHSQEQ